MNEKPDSNTKTETAPPDSHHDHARLTLRVGVTGHRPNNLESMNEEVVRGQILTALEFLRTTINAVHAKAGSLYRPEAPVLRIISPLAEGADRMVAEMAQHVAGSNELQCPLPFYQEEYEKDFSSESVDHFRKLLGTATSVLELDGSRIPSDHAPQSYEAVGRVVLSNADVMITIWSGEKSERRGGTAQIVEEAQRLNIPLIWINSCSPHPLISLKLRGDEDWVAWNNGSAALATKLDHLLMPPPPAGSDGAEEPGKKKKDPRTSYFSQTQPSWNFGFLWKIFRDLVAFKVPATQESPPPNPLAASVRDQIDDALGSQYQRFDQLANYYANAYRSAFVFNYLLIACTVLVAFLGFALHRHKRISLALGIAELITILAVVQITRTGRGRHWHDRWIDYRLLAEHLRHAQFLMALGRVSVSVQRVPAHISYGDPNNSWMYWHFRALMRDAGMVQARFDSSYLKTVRDLIAENGIKGQIDYHELNVRRFEAIYHRLHRWGIRLFIIAAIATIFHFIPNWLTHFVPYWEIWNLLLAMISIVGPAVGGALAAIRSHGEFERLTKRSKAMSSQLTRLYDQLKALTFRDGELCSLKLADLSVRSAQLMIEEVLDWRIVVQEKPLELS